MLHLKVNLHPKMKAIRAVQKTFNIPTLTPKKLPGFTTFPALKMPPLTQFQLHHAVPEIHDSDLYMQKIDIQTL